VGTSDPKAKAKDFSRSTAKKKTKVNDDHEVYMRSEHVAASLTPKECVTYVDKTLHLIYTSSTTHKHSTGSRVEAKD